MRHVVLYTRWGIRKPQLFGEMNEGVKLIPLEACLPKAYILLSIVVTTLIFYILEPGENIAIQSSEGAPIV